jgi:hypothetical protein
LYRFEGGENANYFLREKADGCWGFAIFGGRGGLTSDFAEQFREK